MRSTPPGKEIDGHIIRVPGGPDRDDTDQGRLGNGMERDEGFPVGKYLAPSPMFFNRSGTNIFLEDIYRGCGAFLICGGPSFQKVDKTKLAQAGVLTMGINNSPRHFRPNMWCAVDDPGNFMKSIWFDPKILKFLPFFHSEKEIWDNETWKAHTLKVGDCPSVLYYRRNEHFRADQFLFEDTINWGNHSDLCACGYRRKTPPKSVHRPDDDMEKNKVHKIKVCPKCGQENHWGCRSVMHAALRILWMLGVRRIFLLGTDFKMVEGAQNYSFNQERSAQAVKNNNNTYHVLGERLAELRPIFEKNGLLVYNCNPESELKAFDYLPFDEAISWTTKLMPKDIANERTEGLYDRKAKEKDAAKHGPQGSVGAQVTLAKLLERVNT